MRLGSGGVSTEPLYFGCRAKRQTQRRLRTGLPGDITGDMNTAQDRANAAYRKRLAAQGLARFEVVGRDTDRDLLRRLARKLTEAPDRGLLTTLQRLAAGDEPRRGGILAALRRSPLVDADLDFDRSREGARDLEPF